MNYTDIVKPGEKTNATDWLQGAITALRDRKARVQIKCIKQDIGTLRVGTSVTGSPLCLKGQSYPNGLGAFVGSHIEITLPQGGRRLLGLAGVDDSPATRQLTKGVIFYVEIAGQETWQSGSQATESSPAKLDIDLKGQRKITLKVTGPWWLGFVDWVDLRAELEDGSMVRLDQLEPEPCFSFTYGGRPLVEFWHEWSLQEEPQQISDGIVTQKIRRTDPQTGLQATVEIKKYTEFPVIEWIVRFKNTGQKDTPILEDIQSLNILLPSAGFLNYNTGDDGSRDGYQPHRVRLEPSREYSFAPLGGRPTNMAWPYYNVEYGNGGNGGVIVVVGWPGQWAARFQCRGRGVNVTAGQELTRFTLRPGEEVRTPVSVVMFYEGDCVHAQNLWRRWMIACNMPRPDGKLPAPIMPVGWAPPGTIEFTQATEENQKRYLERYREEGIRFDYCWIDAGWYPCGGIWPRTGTWEVDRQRFPNGLRAVSDFVHVRGEKLLVWFEPERVAPETWLDEAHPEWLLPGKMGDHKLLNLGNDAARKWLADHISRLICEQGIDLYRQDFNIEPLPYWRNNDAPDRQGITEIHYVEGYLAYWDELHRRHPNILIDSCASGGRRNDLETMRRSVPLHKTDYNFLELPVKQAFHHTLASWLPYFGTPVFPIDQVDPYAFRSAYALMTCIGYDVLRKDLDYALLRKLTEEWRQIAPYFYGDYYPLTPFDRDEANWIAWQYDRPDLGEGMVQIFRRAASPYWTARFKLRGLDAAAQYQVVDLDDPAKTQIADGQELETGGLPVTMKTAPQAVIWVYRRTKI